MSKKLPDIVFRKTKLCLKNIDKNRNGELIILVFMEDGFPKNHSQAIKKYFAVPENSEISVLIEVPENQVFAIVVLHDEDLNGKVTKNWTGYIPKEGLGFSSGVTILGGVPKFKKAQIRFIENAALIITMRYPRWFGL